MNTAGYARKIIGVTNTLNQSVSLLFYGVSADGTTKAIGTSIVINANTGGFIGGNYGGIASTPQTWLLEPFSAIYVIATSAPTTGSLTLKMGMEA